MPRGEGYEFQTVGVKVQGGIEIAIMIETANTSPASERGALGFLFGWLRLADVNESSLRDIHFAIRKAHALRLNSTNLTK